MEIAWKLCCKRARERERERERLRINNLETYALCTSHTCDKCNKLNGGLIFLPCSVSLSHTECIKKRLNRARLAKCRVYMVYTWHARKRYKCNLDSSDPVSFDRTVNSEYTRDSHANRHGKLDSIPRVPPARDSPLQ